MRKDDSAAKFELVVQSLVAEIQVLRMAIDELTEEVQWNNQNRRTVNTTSNSSLQNHRVTSCSLDPSSREFAVNPLAEETIAKLRAELPPLTRGSQRELFS